MSSNLIEEMQQELGMKNVEINKLKRRLTFTTKYKDDKKKEAKKYFDLCKQQSNQIRSLEEQLKNAKQKKIYFIGGKAILSEEDFKNKDFLEVKQLNVKEIIEDYISKKGGFIDLVFATREAAEKRLAELKGER